MFKFIVMFKEVALSSTFGCRELERFEINSKVAMRSPQSSLIKTMPKK
jgi:hypothetical protein